MSAAGHMACRAFFYTTRKLGKSQIQQQAHADISFFALSS